MQHTSALRFQRDIISWNELYPPNSDNSASSCNIDNSYSTIQVLFVGIAFISIVLNIIGAMIIWRVPMMRGVLSHVATTAYANVRDLIFRDRRLDVDVALDSITRVECESETQHQLRNACQGQRVSSISDALHHDDHGLHDNGTRNYTIVDVSTGVKSDSASAVAQTSSTKPVMSTDLSSIGPISFQESSLTGCANLSNDIRRLRECV